MPGSSPSSSNTPSKAKVTSATTNGGIFVRPVAVAGIFCPASDSDKPPALPEKRRFSALVGDFRPCSSENGPSSDDFNRRRQSWDTRQKEVPFSQALLRKTPRNIPKKPNPDELKSEKSSSESTPELNANSTSNITSSTKSSTTVFSVQSDVKTSPPLSVAPTNDVANHTEAKINGGSEKEIKSANELKTSQYFNVKISSQSNKSLQNQDNNLHENKSVSTTENTKQPVKVYGLIKRESKSDIIVNQSDITPSDKNASANVTLNKPKVYGVNKITGCDNQNIQTQCKSTNENSISTDISKVCLNKSAENKDIKNSDKKPEKTSENKDLKNSEKKPDKTSVSPPKDFRTVRRTSDVIAAKIQNIFSNFQSDKTSQSSLKKAQISDKRNSIVEAKKDNLKIDIKTSNIQSQKSEKEPTCNSAKETISIISKKKETDKDISNSNNSAIELRNQAILSVDRKSQEISNTKLICNSNDVKDKQRPNKSNVEVKNKDLVNNQGFTVDFSNTAAVSKPAISTIALSSKQQDKKLADIEGKMPIKKADQNISGASNSPLITTIGEVDRKLSDTSILKENTNKELCSMKKQTILVSNSPSVPVNSISITSVQSLASKTVDKTQSLNNKVFETSVDKKIANRAQVKESSQHSIETVSQSFTTTNSVETVSYSNSVNSGVTTQASFKNCTSLSTIANGNAETTEISKIEVTKITPTTTPGIVPTVNVLFRTRSPQSLVNRDENRKKVVIENCDSVISPSVIIPPPKTSCATESVKDAFKTIEDVQKSLNSSPSVTKKHSIVNLRKEEIATVSLSPTLKSIESKAVVTENVMSNGTSSVTSSQPDSYRLSISSYNSSTDLNISPEANKPEFQSKFAMDSKSLASSFSSIHSESNSKYSIGETNVSVLDLKDWNKKFQTSELEAPRVPLRRRALRDSLPPSLPARSISRYGSLKRIEDSPRYVPRSPSQSSLPQRYSYTEMLSKVCSMGVLPFTEPPISKSCSSSSSQVSELWSELSEEQSTATHASEMLEAETSERMRLEKEVHELQNRFSQVQQRSDKMEMEMIENRMYRSPEINGDLSDDETDGNSSLYKQKYERAVRDMELMKRRMQQQQEEEVEQKAMMKKASEKRLAEAMEDIEEERQVANQWKRKAQKLGAELQDIRLMLEEQMGRNGELEKKQRRFDAELSTAQEEIKKERLLREKLTREKDQAISEKYTLEQDLQSTKMDSDMLHEKITQLNRELDELTLSSKGEEEVTQLKRAKQELERKSRDQEEELEELAAQVQMLEQAKLRLEMSLEKVRQEHRREASVREEEIEEIRASFSKKLKNLEAQLEAEQDERHQLMKQKHELERKIYELSDQPPPHDPEIERRLRRDLKRTKALLRDAQSMIEHNREGQSSKTVIRQLKNQLEDSEFAKATAIKARQAIETELQECQLQLEEVTRVKNETESRCLQLSREKSAIQTQLEEAEEEMAEVMKKYKAVVAQMSIDQKTLAEQNQQIAELETERNMLKDQLSEVSHKFEHLAGQSDDTHKVHWLDSKIRDLESKLELEQTTKTRLENQIARLKEQNNRAREECDSLRNKEVQAQEGVRRHQRQLRDLREDYSALQQKEADAYRKQHELEMALENTETDLQVTKNDLRLACQRIQDLQNALEDDLDSGTDVPDDSGSDSDESFELSVLRNTSVTPVQRCDSVASNLSYCTTEEVRSRTSSFSRELSAFSRMMLRRTSMDYLG